MPTVVTVFFVSHVAVRHRIALVALFTYILVSATTDVKINMLALKVPMKNLHFMATTYNIPIITNFKDV